jgi:hypothetical protein
MAMTEFKDLSEREILILIAERQETHAKNLQILNRAAMVLGIAGVFEAGAHLKNLSFVVTLLEFFK